MAQGSELHINFYSNTFGYNILTTFEHYYPDSNLIESMKFSVDKQERYTVISVNEENLNTLNAPHLKSEFVVLHNEGVKNLILDLNDIKYVDSSGLSAILTANRLWENTGTLVLTNVVNENVQQLIKISRLDTVFNIIPTTQESIDFVLMEEIERELQNGADD